MVSMWAAFGHLESIPPLAFAVPAMFAKSSTIYNPLVYILLRPNFRKVMCRDLRVMCRTCLQGCICWSRPSGPEGPSKSGPSAINVMPLRNKRDVSPLSIESKGKVCGCNDTYVCFQNYPKACCSHLNPKAAHMQWPSQKKAAVSDMEIQTKRCPSSRVAPGKRTEDINNLQFILEPVPGHVTLAWP